MQRRIKVNLNGEEEFSKSKVETKDETNDSIPMQT